MALVRETRRVGPVPVALCYDADAPGRLPLLLGLHGFSGRKEDFHGTAESWARQGYFFAALDAHLHGEAGSTPFHAADVTPLLDEVLDVTAGWIDALVAALAADEKVDGARVGWLGVSLGGAVLFRYLERCAAVGRAPAVKTGAALIAGMSSFWPETLRRIIPIYPEFGVTEALIDAARQQVPSQDFLAGTAEIPLLLQYGQDDPIVPIELVRAAVERRRMECRRPEQLVLIEYPQTMHQATAEMFAQAARWFAAHL